MPTYRAHYASADEANRAAAAALVAIEAKAKTASENAGAGVPTTAPTVAVIVDSVVDVPVTAALPETYTDTRVRITAPDGRSEYAQAVMPKTQADSLISAASGTVLLGCSLQSQATFRSRTAKSVQVILMTAAATPLTGLVVQDLVTGKRYTCAVYVAAALGSHTVDVTETDATDTSEVTHGTVLSFLAPPSNVIGTATVNAMKGFSVPNATQLLDESGRLYITDGVTAVADSGISVVGDHTATADLIRDTSDGLEYTTSLAVDSVLTFVTLPTATAATATVTRTGGATVPDATEMYRDVGATRFYYETIGEAVLSDALFAFVPFKARILGPTANRAFADVLTLTTPPTNINSTGTCATTVAAAAYPEPYPSVVVGDAITWATRISRALDGRYIVDLFTIPPGT